MKIVKKISIVIIVLLVLLVGAVFLIPVLFKDQLKAKVEKVASEQVLADVKFGDFDISILRHFPKLTVQLENISVINRAPFEGDTLLAANNFELALNFMSVFKDKVEIHSIYADKPLVNVRVLKDGRASYDIYESTATEETTTADTAAFEIGLEKWNISDGRIRYQDDTLKMIAIIEGLNHTGSGNITTDKYDLSTNTTINDLYINFENVAYIAHRPVSADATLEMDMKNMKFTFKENEFKVNDLPLKMDGWLSMPENTASILMDLNFSTPETNFKSLLSLIPPVFLKDYEGLEAKGEFVFKGMTKGEFNSEKELYPEFDISLLIKDGYFKYPELPTAVENVNVDMQVVNTTANLNNTVIDIKTFGMNLGKNPINGKVRIQGLEKYDIDANINATVNLAELAEIYPMDSLEIKGLYNLKLLAKGVYDEAQNRIPTIDADMTLKNGYVKSLAYPIPIENLEVEAHAKNTTGQMENMRVDLEKITMQVEGKPFSVSGHTEGVENLVYDLMIKGELDLATITKIVPLEDMTVTGLIKVDIETKGSTAALDAEKYDQLPTSGDLSVQNLVFTSVDLPQGMKITNAKVSFTPQQMILDSFQGFLGKSDIALTGGLSNYIAYALAMAGFQEGKPVIRGNMNLTSNQFNVDEWMTETDDPTTVEDETGVVEVPKDIDFTFNATIEKVLYDNMTLNNMRGLVRVKDGEVRMDNLTFDAVGGKFRTSGLYSSKDLARPIFSFDLDIIEANIGEAFKTFSTAKAFAPLAESLDGKFSLNNFNITGLLKSDMMPDMATLSGGGMMKIVDAMMKDNPSINKLAAVANMPKLKNSRLKDVVMQTKIEDGKMKIQPFDLNFAGYKSTIGGTTALDGGLDFHLKVDVPKEEALSLVSGLVNIKPEDIENSTIPLFFNIGGTYNSPSVAMDNSAIKSQIKSKVTQTLKEEATKTGKELLNDFFGNKNDSKTDSTKSTKADSTKTTNPIEKAKEDLKNKLKGLGGFGKKK
ncbi:AsmA-like C-terminal region-containing protein [Bernardetia sp. Wsw4-3y2]|uniref:AsmA family protein n=1 Tax=Bernardetia sp. Wsw4-3y2 TaxID=3127471 RepID=UPI0030D45933